MPLAFMKQGQSKTRIMGLLFLEAVFPSGKAHLHGMNLPVTAGNYRVTFNSRTFEYEFEKVEGY